MRYFPADVGGHASPMSGVRLDKAIDLVIIRRGRDIVAMFADIKIGLFAKPLAGTPIHFHAGQIVHFVATIH